MEGGLSLKAIYKITNKINNKCYIGQSNNPMQRWKSHKSHTNIGDDIGKSAIHDAMRKYGIENFEFSIIIFVLYPYLNFCDL